MRAGQAYGGIANLDMAAINLLRAATYVHGTATIPSSIKVNSSGAI
jgi:hypothetical protein